MGKIEVCEWCGKGAEDDFTIFWPDKIKEQIKKALNLDFISSMHFCSMACIQKFYANRGAGRTTRKMGDTLVMVDGEETVDRHWTREDITKAELKAKRSDRLWKEKEKDLAESGYKGG